MVSVLAQVDPLPGAQVQSSIADRDGQIRANHGCLDMACYVVRALIDVREHTIRCPFLGRDFIEGDLEVRTDRGVGILINRQGGRGVLNKNVASAHGKAAELGAYGLDDCVMCVVCWGEGGREE